MKCGTKIPDDARFCISCGYKIESEGNINNITPQINIPKAETKMVPAKCTNCNGALRVDSSKDAAVCPYCNSAFIVSKAINNISVNNNVKIEKASFSLDGGSITINNQVNVENCLIRAMESVKLGDYNNAVNYMNKALDQDPRNPNIRRSVRDLYLAMAIKQYQLNYRMAINAVSSALLYDDDMNHLLITDICLYFGANDEMRIFQLKKNFVSDDYIRIREYYKKAYSINPNDALAKASFSRMNYIIEKYEYFTGRERLLADTNRKYSLTYNEIKFERYSYLYPRITNLRRLDGCITFVYDGAYKSLYTKLTDTGKIFTLLSAFISNQRVVPDYAKLQELGLISLYQGHYVFVEYKSGQLDDFLNKYS